MCRNHSHAVVESLGPVESNAGVMLEVVTVQPLTLESPNGGKLTFSPGLHFLLPSLSMADCVQSVVLATGAQYAFSSPEELIAFVFTVIPPEK